ncbi:MAG: zf-HC2 domain-containing protein [bacterium]
MTCHSALALLDDLVDNDLDQALAGKLRDHLDTCPSCQSEYQATIRLKELLRQSKSQGPDRNYWNETTPLIMARTVEAAEVDFEETTREQTIAAQRNALVRSLVSLAASVVILISAVLIGQNHLPQNYADRMGSESSRLYVVSAAADQLSYGAAFFAADQRSRLARGMLLMGPPGLFGRFAMLDEPPSPEATSEKNTQP